MKILVTGANGLLGQKLIALLESDSTIHCIATARTPSATPTSPSTFVSLDVTNADQVDRVLGEQRPDVIIHTAAMTMVDLCETEREACWLNNVTAVEYIVAGCHKYGIHLIHVSTDFIFDGTHGPLDESATPAPVNFYGESKLASEKIVQHSPIAAAILRTVLVYGITPDMSRSNIVLWVKQNLAQGKPIKVVDDQWRTPTLAEDLAQGCYLAAIKKATGIYNISGSDFLTPYQIALLTAEHFKLDASLITKTDSNAFKQTAARPLKTGFIIDKARKELGYTPHTFREGLALLEKQLERLSSSPI